MSKLNIQVWKLENDVYEPIKETPIDANDLLKDTFPWHHLSTTKNAQWAKNIKSQIEGIQKALDAMEQEEEEKE